MASPVKDRQSAGQGTAGQLRGGRFRSALGWIRWNNLCIKTLLRITTAAATVDHRGDDEASDKQERRTGACPVG